MGAPYPGTHCANRALRRGTRPDGASGAGGGDPPTVVANLARGERRNCVHPEVRLLEAAGSAAHLRPGHDYAVLEHFDEAMLRIEVDSDLELDPTAHRERTVRLDLCDVRALDGNVEHV